MMSPTSVGLFFNRGAAREEAGIAGQSSFLFLPWNFIFLGICCHVFQIWEAKGGGSQSGLLQEHLFHITHLFQDLAVGSGTDGIKEAQSWGHLSGILQFEGAFGILGLFNSAQAILALLTVPTLCGVTAAVHVTV